MVNKMNKNMKYGDVEFYDIKVVLVGEHYEVFCDGKMVCKKDSLQNILDNGVCPEFYDTCVFSSAEDTNEKIGKIINGLFTGEYVKVEDAAYETQNRCMSFIDLLNSDRQFDCGLIIGDVDMPADLVWNETSRITDYGAEVFAELMQAEAVYDEKINCIIVYNGDDYEIGERFAWAAAGYINYFEYYKMFVEVE